MPDQQNPANKNSQNLSSQSQNLQNQSQNQKVDPKTTSEEADIQKEINQMAGNVTSNQQRVASQKQDLSQGKGGQQALQQLGGISSAPKPVVEETSAPPPPTPPSMGTGDGGDSGGLPPLPSQEGEDRKKKKKKEEDDKQKSPPPPGGEGSSQKPPGDIPPAVSAPKPKRKFGRKRLIATILGALVLVGGLGAGVILVQNNQDLRERAASIPLWKRTMPQPGTSTPDKSGKTDSKTTSDKTEKTDSKTSSDKNGGDDDGGKSRKSSASKDECSSDFDCRAEQECIRGQCVVKKTPTPALPSQECSADVDCLSTEVCSGGVCKAKGGVQTSPPDSVNACDRSAPSVAPGPDNRYCTDKKFGSSCQTRDGQSGSCQPIGDPTQGTQVECKCVAGSAPATAETTTTTTSSSSALTARCLNILAYDIDWNQLTATELGQLSQGDSIRLAVSGNTTNGTIDMARFTINGVQRSPVTQKLTGTNLFYDEYTIPEGTTSFNVSAQLHHTDPSVGWF